MPRPLSWTDALALPNGCELSAPAPNILHGRGLNLTLSSVRGFSPNDIAAKVGCTVGLVYNIKSTSSMTGRAVVKRGPGRQRKVVATATGLDGIAGIVAAVQNSERDRVKMRGALERIQAVLADVLA